MLRSLIVLILGLVGLYCSLQAPFYALLTYLAYSYFRPEEWLWDASIIPPNLLFVLGAYVFLASLFSRQRPIMKNRLHLIYFFLVHSFLSIVFSKYFATGWVPWINFFKSVIITYCIVVLTTDYTKLRSILLILALFLGLEGGKQGWVYLLTSPGWGANPNPIAFLGDNNGVAVGMLMLVPVVAFLAQTAQHKWQRRCFVVLLIGVLYRALSTYSRGGFLSAIALGGTYVLRSQQKLRLLLPLAVIVAIVLLALPSQFWARMNTIETYEEDQDNSALGRLHFWQIAIKMANANPVLGIGNTCYNVAYDEYDFLQGQFGQRRSVHSSFFGIIAEAGYVGAALYVGILFSALRSCQRVRKLTMPHPQLLALSQCATALETSLVIFIVGGSFLPFQYNEMLWHYIGFTIVLEELAVQYVSASINVPDAAPRVVALGTPAQ